MKIFTKPPRGIKTRSVVAAVLLSLGMLSGCGGGSVELVAEDPPLVASLDLVLTRVGPEAVQLDWSDDPAAASFEIRRNGIRLARVNAVSLIDTSLQFDGDYCYDVLGFDQWGYLVSGTSYSSCITVFP